MENILIVCRDNIKLFSSWKKSISAKSKANYFVATDNNIIRSLSENADCINEIFFLEKNQAFFSVAEAVIEIQTKINVWLADLQDQSKGFFEQMLYFNRHVEGGYTSQRVQDILLLINSYIELLNQKKIDCVIVLRSNSMMWEDEVLIQTLLNSGIQTKIIQEYTFEYYFNKIKNGLRPYLYEIYFFVQFLLIRVQNIRTKKRLLHGNEIIFQLCSSANKHVENIMANMRAMHGGRYMPVVLSWGTIKGAKKIKKNGFLIDQMENCLSLVSYLRSIKKIFYTWEKAKKLKISFINELNISYKGFEIADLLWPSIRHLIFAELGKRWRIAESAKNYFKHNQPIAISTWGINDLPEGKMVLDELRKYDRPFIFKYYLSMAMFETPYRIVFKPVDLYLVGGEYQLSFNVNKLGIPAQKNAIVGQARYGKLEQFQKEYSKKDSLSILNIPDSFKFYILFDFTATLRGYISFNEQHITFSEVLKFVNANSDVALIVKPHPNINVAELKAYNLPSNVFIVNKNSLPYHSLNACDFFITKYSTVGFEAMLFSKPIISVILDDEKAWQVYIDAAEYIFQEEKISQLLDELVNDRTFYQNWVNSQIEKQKIALPKLLGPSASESANLTAKAILSRLENYNKQPW